MGLIFGLVRDEAALHALGPAWDALEARALPTQAAPSAPLQPLYASHRYVSLAWQHLRSPRDELAIVTLHEGEVLRAVWPLARHRERVMGLPVWVLSPIGIWEGERPGILCVGPEDAAWAALWAGLLRHRSLWHGLDLRELDPGHWLLRSVIDAPGLQVQQAADHRTPYQVLDGSWRDHVAGRSAPTRDALQRAAGQWAQRVPPARVVIVRDAAAILAAFSRYLAIDAAWPQDSGDSGAAPSPYLLGRDAARVAFYRALLPRMAACGDAQVWLLEGAKTGDRAGVGDDVAALLRLRGGGVWLERHATEHPAWRELAPSGYLLLQALEQSWQGSERESDLLVPPGATGRDALAGWYDGERATQRLRVWNLRFRLALKPLQDHLRGRGR